MSDTENREDQDEDGGEESVWDNKDEDEGDGDDSEGENEEDDNEEEETCD